MGTLIAYFSRKGNNYVRGKIVNLAVGNTEAAAEMIQELTDGELFEIEAVHPYSEDYATCTEEAQEELRANARPELTTQISDFEQYDVIYLGYPNWWGTMPMPVFAFLEQYNFDGKTIRPFCTNEGSGMGRSEADIKRLCPTAKVGKGLAIHGGSVSGARPAIAAWVKEGRES